MLSKTIKYATYVASPIIWWHIGTFDKTTIRAKMFDNGYQLSQKFKAYPQWDAFVEPLIIKQFAIIFTAGNSFIKGMVSDNDRSIDTTIKEYANEVLAEIKK